MTMAAEHTHNERLFGASIVGVFMEEKVALFDAQTELTHAENSVEVTACVLVCCKTRISL